MANARAQAAARQEVAIQENVTQIEAAKARPTALAQMAGRLHIPQDRLIATLKATVFKGAKDEEFAALIIVANEYRLNPLTKEIYAFPAKGGGIVPVVSIDGWLRIINEHPQFDGLEHEDMHDDAGNLYAIECSIWRKDRGRPVKVIEYLTECKRNTEPWKDMPSRMLRHKATIQCARYAFGFSGIDGEQEEGGMVNVTPARDAGPPPTRAAIEQHDPDTGEVFDPVDEDAEREAAMAADREGFAEMDGADEPTASAAKSKSLVDALADANTPAMIDATEAEFRKHEKAMDDADREAVETALTAARKAVAS